MVYDATYIKFKIRAQEQPYQLKHSTTHYIATFLAPTGAQRQGLLCLPDLQFVFKYLDSYSCTMYIHMLRQSEAPVIKGLGMEPVVSLVVQVQDKRFGTWTRS